MKYTGLLNEFKIKKNMIKAYDLEYNIHTTNTWTSYYDTDDLKIAARQFIQDVDSYKGHRSKSNLRITYAGVCVMQHIFN